MSNICGLCGRTESEAMADAKMLGLQQEFGLKIYTCCQIAEWADEQAFAWFRAIAEDSKRIEEAPELPQLGDPEPVLIKVRSRRSQVPWYREPIHRAECDGHSNA